MYSPTQDKTHGVKVSQQLKKNKNLILPVKIQGSRQDPIAAPKGLFIFQTEIRTQKKEHRPGRNNKKNKENEN